MRTEIDRRTMLAQSMLAAAGVVLCGCTISDATAPSSVSSTTLKVGDHPSLAAVGGVELITISNSPIAVVRTGQSAFVALSRICPHQGATVNEVSGGFLCPRHGAEFSSNGTHIGGQPTSNMTSYPASYNAATDILTIG